MLVCFALLVPVLTGGVATARNRALAVLLLGLGADAAVTLAELVETSAIEPGSALQTITRRGLALTMPAFALWFASTVFPGRRGSFSMGLVVALLTAGAAVSLTGAFPRVLGGGSASRVDVVLAAALATLQIAVGAAIFDRLRTGYRRHRDPFERNRMKYAGLALAGLSLGTVFAWVPSEEWHLYRQGANALSALVLGFGLLRQRPPDFDGAVRGGVGHLLVGAPTSFMYVGALVMLVRGFGIALGSLTGLLLAVVLGLGAAFVAAYMRAVSAHLLERPFEARRREREARLSALARDAGSIRTVEELASALTVTCQAALDASYVALLAGIEAGEPLRVLAAHDPEVARDGHCSISADNELLRRLADARCAVTPFALAAIIEAGGLRDAAVAEFAPFRDCLLVPLVSQGEAIGLLVAGPRTKDAAYRLGDLELLASIAGGGALPLQNAQLLEQLRDAAQTDFITGLPNHRQVQDIFTRLVTAADEQAAPVSCAIVDIEGFKHFNDTFGRQSGDEALALIARTIVNALGPGDVVGRYGGDEFLVLLPGASRREASEALTRVGAAVRGLTLTPAFAPASAPLSAQARVTWGIASMPEDGSSRRALASVADSRLMQRKFEGRRPASISAGRPVAGQLLESDPEKLRVARGLLELIAEKDPQTAERSQQTAALALLVADDLRLSERERYELWLGSLLHDVGKIGTPEAVLGKVAPLSPEEWIEIRKHAVLGERLIRGLLGIEAVSEIAGCHHERFDGLGYPRGLVGDEIPRMARIVSVADAFAAMVHDRPHTPKMPWPEAMVELRRHAGQQFDPALIEVFLRAVGRSNFPVAA